MRSEGRTGKGRGDGRGKGKRGSGGRKGGRCVGAGWKRAQEEEHRNGRGGTWPWMAAGLMKAARRK